MANPLTLGTETEFSSKSNLHSLGDGEAKPLGDVDCSSAVYYDAWVSPIRFETDGSGWAAGDTCSLYLIHTLGALTTAAEWTDGIDPDSSTDIASSIIGAKWIQTIPTEANSTRFWFDGFSLRQKLGFVPYGWTVVVKNGNTTAGADFSATAGDAFAKYRLITYA